MDIKSIDELTRKLSEALPPGLRSLGEETEAQFRSILQAGLQKMDLVTREEFDVQTEVLTRTRAMLEELQERINRLEAD